MLDHSIVGMVLGQYVTQCIHEKRATLSSLKASPLKLPKSFCIAGRYSTPSSLDWQVETDTIVISSRKRYIKYAFVRGVRTIRSDAIVYKDGLLHRR